MTTNRFSQLLASHQHVVLDGAMATELEKRGVDTASDLWSATALIDHPERVKDVHTSYFEAGAHIATTNTYQANVPAFTAHGLSETESERLIKAAVHIAVTARNEYAAGHPESSDLVVAASIGPYGAFLADGSEYTGNYHLNTQDYKNFHRQRLHLVSEAGADVFALETMPNAGELHALIELLDEEFQDAEAWVSLSLKDSEHLCDGTALSEIIPLLEACPRLLAVGVNCTAQQNVEPALRVLKELTSKPLIVYPNSGEEYDPVTKTWTAGGEGASFTANTPVWKQNGAHIVGGCCRTTPADIAEIALAGTGNN